MDRRSRKPQSSPDASALKPSAPFNNPFESLSAMREELPSGEPPRPSRPTSASSEGLEGHLARCGKLTIQREKKGRAGKTVTRISGLSGELIEELEPLVKSALGCGATRENADLLLLGSLVDRAASWLEQRGAAKIVISGATGHVRPLRRLPKADTRESASERTDTSRQGTLRDDLRPGLTVDIVLKRDQSTGALTRGVIQELLTKSRTHPRGIKVRLEDGSVGRVRRVLVD